MSALIDVRRLSKAYTLGADRVQALRGIDLAVDPGEHLAIMGTSGSGKSTLLHILGCLDTPTGGEYHLDGRNISDLDDRALSRIRSRSVGFVFQTFNLIPEYSVMENVSLPLLYQGIAEAEAKERAGRSISTVGLDHRAQHRPKELSGGEMQRAAIARALVADPLIILADEPTGNLDAATGREILALFGELHRKGATILTVTHDPDVAAACRRILRLEDGRLS